MAFFRSLKQNLINLQDIFRKRKRSQSASSRRDSGRNNSENNPVSNQPSQQQDIQRVQSPSPLANDASRKSPRSPVLKRKTEHDDRAHQEHRQGASNQLGGRTLRNQPSPSNDGVESDSELEDRGVPRCQCSRTSPFSRPPEFLGIHPANVAEEIYGESDTTCRKTNVRKDKSAPSTSRQSAELGLGSGGNTDTGHSSCSQEDQLMEEMVSVLKTRGSLSRRRSRSRSRRSRPRQSFENGLVVNSVRVTPTIPRRETDSDESNTSLNDLPLTFLSSTQQNSTSQSNVQSDSSFHSATGSGVGIATPQASSASTKVEEENVRFEEETEEWGVGGNSTEHNRSRTDEPMTRQVEELSSYGPEEFVLDLLFAMCRGTWSDIL